MDKRYKILHVSHGGLGNGGVSAVINSITENLCTEYQFGCIVYTKHCNREEEFSRHGLIHRIDAYNSHNKFTKLVELIKRPFNLTIGTYRICKKGQYDIIHCHNGWESAFCLIGAWLAGVKKRIAHAHNPIIKSGNPAKNIFITITSWLINIFSTHRLGCSEGACKTSFSKSYKVINNAIDLSKFTWDNKATDKIQFIHVGRFGYQKNQNFIIDVFNELNKLRSNIQLNLIGFGPHSEIDLLSSKIKEFNLESKINILDGTKENIANAFAQSHYMIFPSNFEGFGIVILEAQASGVHCFVSENIPNVTNMGLWEKIELCKGAKYWAQIICNRIQYGPLNEKQDVLENLKQFDMKVIAKHYKSIYDAK